MAIALQVEAELNAALKARDAGKVSALRLVRAALQNKAKELRRELSPEEELQVLAKMAKERRDSMEQFAQGGRQDLVDQEAAELAIIEAYLPAQMDPAAVEAELDQVFAELQPQGMKDMGRAMKAAMERLQGRADGKLVSQLVRARLAG